MTTGEPLIVRCAMKPLPTLTKPLRSVDIATREPAQALRERTDSCVVPAAGVVGEAMLAIVLAGAYREKFGGDHIDDVRRRSPPTRSGSGGSGGGRRHPGGARLHRLHGRREDDRRPRRRRGARRPRRRLRPVIEERLGSRSRTTSPRHGERAFRELEEEVVCELLETPPAPVLSLGGGAIGSERVREALARHTVVLLDVDAGHRLAAGGRQRPLARDRERFEALHAERAPLYDALADACCPTARATRPPRRAGDPRAARRAAGDAHAVGAHRLGEYPVYVGDGVLGSGRWPPEGRPFLVTDETVGRALRERGGERRRRRASRPARRPRRWGNAERVLRGLAAAGMDHDDHVVALGGGVVGDLAGFCAAVYQRGVPVVQVPTTLVAQVDSAYGGKTGVDLPEGKNYAGAYHQPAAVLADPAVLATLPPAEELAGRLGRGDQDRADRRRRRCGSACAAVRRDVGRRPRARLRAHQARGRRRGRARRRPPPGAQPRPHRRARDRDRDRLRALPARRGRRARPARGADALGPAGAARRGRGAARAHGLPTQLDADVDHEAVVAAVQRDKKRRGGRVGFVLVEAPGRRAHRPPMADDVRAAAGRVARLMRNRVAVLHGVNLDALDRRPAEHYGG